MSCESVTITVVSTTSLGQGGALLSQEKALSTLWEPGGMEAGVPVRAGLEPVA